MRRVTIPFELRGLAGIIDVAVDTNEHPAELGCGLLAVGVPAGAATGFPVCTAIARYNRNGYAATFGWIQVVRSTDGARGGTEFEIDPLALFRDVDTPYAFFGVKPTLFDAPFRAHRADLVWEAHTFMCFAPDAVMSKQVHAVAGFTWGFGLKDRQLFFQGPTPLSAADWDHHVPLLSDAYPRWHFRLGFRST